MKYELLQSETIHDINDGVGGYREENPNQCVDDSLFRMFHFFIVSHRSQKLNTTPRDNEYSQESYVFNGFLDNTDNRGCCVSRILKRKSHFLWWW
jgi:hypothetical protein